MRNYKTRLVLAVVSLLFVVATVSSSLVSDAEAQNRISFTTSDRFSIPELNGSIRFAYNGSYSSAQLVNGSWIFKDLAINTTRRLGNLNLSVQDSNITIYSFYSSDAISTTRQYIRYYAEGAGRQVVNLGINGTTHPSEWYVTINMPNSVFLAEGKEWHLLADNTAIVSGQTGNVSVSHFIFGANSDSNLPFEQRHSVIIITAALLAVTVVVAAVISVKVRRNKSGN